MLGIMLARPVSSFVTAALSWHAVFFASAGAHDRARDSALDDTAEAQAGCAHALRRVAAVDAASGEHHAAAAAPRALPGGPVWRLHAVLDGGATPAREGEFGFTQRGIALFALAGVAGVASGTDRRTAGRSRP